MVGVDGELLHVVLVEPQIAANTGNLIRLCANTGCVLHLVEPLGFSLDEPRVRRAGLDYHELADVRVHKSWPAVRIELGDRSRWFALTSGATARYDGVSWRPGDVVVFGAERTGLAADIVRSLHPLRLPMRPGNRSLNLANAVAVVVYEAWRQFDFAGGDGPGSMSESTGDPG